MIGGRVRQVPRQPIVSWGGREVRRESGATGRKRLRCPLAILFAMQVLASVAVAQESIRRADGPGEFTKFLTQGQLDTWIIEGVKGEAVVAHVVTGEFAPVTDSK